MTQLILSTIIFILATGGGIIAFRAYRKRQLEELLRSMQEEDVDKYAEATLKVSDRVEVHVKNHAITKVIVGEKPYLSIGYAKASENFSSKELRTLEAIENTLEDTREYMRENGLKKTGVHTIYVEGIGSLSEYAPGRKVLESERIAFDICKTSVGEELMISKVYISSFSLRSSIPRVFDLMTITGREDLENEYLRTPPKHLKSDVKEFLRHQEELEKWNKYSADIKKIDGDLVYQPNNVRGKSTTPSSFLNIDHAERV